MTWKSDGAGGTKDKARLVALGFQDPSLGGEDSNSPTLSRRGRNMIFQLAASRRWRLWKADMKAADKPPRRADATERDEEHEVFFATAAAEEETQGRVSDHRRHSALAQDPVEKQ